MFCKSMSTFFPVLSLQLARCQIHLISRQICFVSVLVMLYPDCSYITNPKIHILYQKEKITLALCQIIMSKALKEEGRRERLEILIL